MNPRTELLEHIPHLRAFAGSLAGRGDRADDLVQETLVRAWDKLSSFQSGTNMRAWLFTILRNAHYSDLRRHRREVEDSDGMMASRLSVPPAQCERIEFIELCTAWQTLPSIQREALILIDASGFSYEESATIANCAIGTVKSRVNRARARLMALLPLEGGSPPGQKRAVGHRQAARRLSEKRFAGGSVTHEHFSHPIGVGALRCGIGSGVRGTAHLRRRASRAGSEDWPEPDVPE